MTALDGFLAEKCAPRSTGATKPLGGRQPSPPEHGERGGSAGLGGGVEGGGEGGGGEGAPIATKTVASKVTATSGLSSTDTPSMADKAANGCVACASALATRAEASAEVLTMFSCRFTLAAVTARLAWHSGG